MNLSGIMLPFRTKYQDIFEKLKSSTSHDSSESFRVDMEPDSVWVRTQPLCVLTYLLE